MAPQWGWYIDHDQDQAAMALGERIRQLRKEAGLSQADLAEQIGADPGHVSRYEAGRITRSADALVRLAETLNVSIDHLLIDDIPAAPPRRRRRPRRPPRRRPQLEPATPRGDHAGRRHEGSSPARRRLPKEIRPRPPRPQRP